MVDAQNKKKIEVIDMYYKIMYMYIYIYAHTSKSRNTNKNTDNIYIYTNKCKHTLKKNY